MCADKDPPSPPPCSGVQPLPVRQRFDAGQRLLPETRRQEVAQHGQPELHEEVHQAVEWRVVNAGHHPEGISAQTGSPLIRKYNINKRFYLISPPPPIFQVYISWIESQLSDFQV